MVTVFSDIVTDQVIQGFGLPAAIVIVALAGVIIFLYKSREKLQAEYNALQNQRVVDAKETRDKITEPLQSQAVMTGKIYEFLLGRGK